MGKIYMTVKFAINNYNYKSVTFYQIYHVIVMW